MSVILEVETNHGKRSVICDRYAYRLDQYLQGGNISWRCTQKRCKARIRTNRSLTEVLQRKNEHSHEADERKIERQILRARSKRKAVEDANEKLSKIVCTELENVEKQFLHPADLRNITKAMSRLRRKHGIGQGKVCDLNRRCMKHEPKLPVKEDDDGCSPDLSSIIKVEPVDTDELLENDRFEDSFCVKQEGEGSGQRENGSRQDGGRERREEGGRVIMELLQGAQQRFEHQVKGVTEAKGKGGRGESSEGANVAEPSAFQAVEDSQKSLVGGPVLQELFKSAVLNQQRQQKVAIKTEPQATPPPPTDPTFQPISSTEEAQEKTDAAALKVPDPYSLLASGGMTVEEFERRQRLPPHLWQQEKQQQKGESTTGQPEEEGGNSAPRSDQDTGSTTQSVPEQDKGVEGEGSRQEIPSADPGVDPPRTVELLTPSDFEKQCSVVSRQKAAAATAAAAGRGRAEVLLTPGDFVSPLRSSVSSPSLSSLCFPYPSSPVSPQIEPLTRSQFQQAMVHMIRTDEEFVNKLHKAYLDSFLLLKNRISKR
ncbi:uncharacterized protein LOC143284840 isoform X2 [Babylonia areolata]|uniref:uncharacterized protein LOC143284840 isoform X2 n=1 Tax=Babylonia areolata TaxID=304850 RepID=UPI003FD30E0E